MTGGEQNRLVLAVLVAAVVVGSLGLLKGLSERVEPMGYHGEGERTAPDGGVVEAPTQEELATGLHGPNRGRFIETLARLRAARPALTDPVEPATEEAWNAALARRAERRAFDGAPPAVPHPIDQSGFPNCVACHGEGVVIGGLVAPPMSHGVLSNCTQCHVRTESPVPGAALAGGPPPESSFEGVRRSGRGSRAAAGAPPTIPHATPMRERCASCHGVLAGALRSSHACRQNCEQCHAPSAVRDQSPRTSPPTLPLATYSR